MANEMTLLANVRAIKGNFQHDVNAGQKQYDMAVGSGGNPGVVSVTTASAAISFGAVTPGVVFIKNLSTDTAVGITTTGGTQIGYFKAGMQAVWPKGSGGWKAVVVSTGGGTALVDIRGFST